MKIEKISIIFPHATTLFSVLTDDTGLIDLLKMYYGSLTNECEYVGATIIQYVNGLLSVCNNDKCFKSVELTPQNALSSIIMYIRNHMRLEDDWFIYHGSCSVIAGKTYLFIGHSAAGKTTLTTYLHYQPNVITVSEDVSIVNYKNLRVEPIQKPFLLRPSSYKLLTTRYDLSIRIVGVCNYNINEKIIAASQSIVPNQNYKIDEIVSLHLCDEHFCKSLTNDASLLLENSYNNLDVFKGVCSSSIISKKIPIYTMRYYALDEVYECLIKGKTFDNEKYI